MASICCNFVKFNKLYSITRPLIKYNSTISDGFLKYDKDPGPSFNNSENQVLLKSLTRIDLQKIFKKRSVPNNTISYKFMTTQEVEDEISRLGQKAQRYLQMPPIVKVVEDAHQIISNDPALKHFSDSAFVFTDITFGLKSAQRKIVVRNVDGSFENGALSVRKRMNQIYFPLEGRTFHLPRMFEPEHLAQCLKDKKYEFVLDRLCVQFEPYDKEFHEISSKVYLDVNESKSFQDLRSTRHFGPLAFFLAWHKIIDNLLIDIIQRDYLQNGVELIALMYNLGGITYTKDIVTRLSREDEIVRQYKPFKTRHDEMVENSIGKTESDFKNDDLFLEFIETYVKDHSAKRPQLELAIQSYKEISTEKQKILEGLNRAHGLIQN